MAGVPKSFQNDAEAEKWLMGARWPQGPVCPVCRNTSVQPRITRKPQPFRCRACRKDFSVKTGTLMQGSNLGFRTWALAIHMMSIDYEGQPNVGLHRTLGITRKSARRLAFRIWETWVDCMNPPFIEPVKGIANYVSNSGSGTHTEPRHERPGRPEKPFPPRIPDSAENIAKIIIQCPPKRDWRYLTTEAKQMKPPKHCQTADGLRSTEIPPSQA